MFNQRFLFVAFFVLCLNSCIQIFLFANEMTPSNEDHLKNVNLRINWVKNELHHLELKVMKSEVTSENYMKYEWGKYTKEIQKSEEYEQKIEILKKELQKLEEEKSLILQKLPSNEAKF